ncbi:hypothetical protein BN2476_350082 [Paraburkholderia piptadeniae]|uniref:Uncharacterized protein n=1 Tax=Paraburkholderia piptadeniae TaxID=1701573 RepID=A0A1N7S7U5_9BURK|nr:hypothetical protein BN2476_350082 [Paraburkholderia piptadeniae]
MRRGRSRAATGTGPLSTGTKDISTCAQKGLAHTKMSFFTVPETRRAWVSLLLRPDAQGMRKRTATRFGLVRTGRWSETDESPCIRHFRML